MWDKTLNMAQPISLNGVPLRQKRCPVWVHISGMWHLFHSSWVVLRVNRWTVTVTTPGPPAPSSAGPAYRPTGHGLISISHWDRRRQPLDKPHPDTVHQTFIVLLFFGAEDERSGGGDLFSVRSAAQHILHYLCSLGRPIAGPGGQSPEGPGPGPDAACREEVLLPSPTGRLVGRGNRWASASPYLSSLTNRWWPWNWNYTSHQSFRTLTLTLIN